MEKTEFSILVEKVHKHIKKNPGLTSYRISRNLGENKERVQSALRTLWTRDDIKYEEVYEEGRLIRKYLP